MFAPKTSFAARLSDAVDLIIDFATLGEYGLEPTHPRSADCELRNRPRAATRRPARARALQH